MSTPSITIAFDPTITVSYGYYECVTCHVKFYIGGARCCPHINDPLIYHYGPQEKSKLDEGRNPGLSPGYLLDLYKASAA